MPAMPSGTAVVGVVINGTRHELPCGRSVLDALRAAHVDVPRTTRDQRRLSPRRGEQRNVAGHQHDVEHATQVEVAQIGDDPRQLGTQPARGRDHRRVDIGSHHVDASTGELTGRPPGAATGVEHRSGSPRHHEVDLAVNGDARCREVVEPSLVVVAVPAHPAIMSAEASCSSNRPNLAGYSREKAGGRGGRARRLGGQWVGLPPSGSSGTSPPRARIASWLSPKCQR